MDLRNAVGLTAALAATVAVGAGCAHRGAPPSAGNAAGAGSFAETETLRSVRQPVVIQRSAATGHTFFQVGAPDDPEGVALVLRPAEIGRLRAVPAGKPVEVRYWESLSRSVPGRTEVRVGELDGILDGPRLLVDRSTCELHDQRMARREALILYGLPSAKFIDAWQTFFPHAALTLGGGVVGPDSPRTGRRHVCPVCQDAYEHWAEAGGAEKK